MQERHMLAKWNHGILSGQPICYTGVEDVRRVPLPPPPAFWVFAVLHTTEARLEVLILLSTKIVPLRRYCVQTPGLTLENMCEMIQATARTVALMFDDSATSSAYCIHCGNRILRGSRFCSSCGQRQDSV